MKSILKICRNFKKLERLVFQNKRPRAAESAAPLPRLGPSHEASKPVENTELPENYKEKVETSIASFTNFIDKLLKFSEAANEMGGLFGAKISKTDPNEMTSKISESLAIHTLNGKKLDLKNLEHRRIFAKLLIFLVAEILEIKTGVTEEEIANASTEKLYKTIVTINKTLKKEAARMLKENPELKGTFGSLEIFDGDTVTIETFQATLTIVIFKKNPDILKYVKGLKGKYGEGKIPYSSLEFNNFLTNPNKEEKLEKFKSFEEEEIKRKAAISRKYIRGEGGIMNKVAKAMGAEADFTSQNNKTLLTSNEAVQEVLRGSDAVNYFLEGNLKWISDFVFGPAQRRSMRVCLFEKGHIKLAEQLMMLELDVPRKAAESYEFALTNNIDLIETAKNLGINANGFDLSYDDDIMLLVTAMERILYPNEPEQWNGIFDNFVLSTLGKRSVSQKVAKRLKTKKKTPESKGT